MKQASRLKALVTFALTATLIGAYVLNAVGQIKGTFNFEPHWSLIAVFLFVVGGGVFELSVETLSLIRGFLKRGDDLMDKLIEEDKEGGK